MKLMRIGKTTTQVTKNNGDQVLVSYETPVAACVAGKWYRTADFWSVTTSKQINKWLLGISTVSTMPQSFFDELL